MILTFIAASTPRPIGGNSVIYELAGAMVGLGHTVHLFHVPIFGEHVRSLEEIGWFELDPGIHHHFPGAVPPEAEAIPAADVIFGYSPLVDAMPHVGQPVALVQGDQMVGGPIEAQTWSAPCPKVCVAGWLLDVGRRHGVPREHMVHLPCGLRHDVYEVRTPVGRRPPLVSLCYNSHAQKGADVAGDVLTSLRSSHPHVRAVAFGGEAPGSALPPWVEYHRAPARPSLVEIYNQSQVFLCTSHVEGLGLPSMEAMACGAALVTTDNGGSQDFAVDQETALVSAPGDVEALVANVARLLDEPRTRATLVAGGISSLQERTWSRSAELLEAFLVRYLADPGSHGRLATSA